MIGQTVIFDGHRFNDRFFVGEADVGLPEFAPRAEDREFADGSRVRGMRLGCPEVSVQLVAKPVQGESFREALSDLCAWLNVDGPRKLVLGDDHGLWRMCVPTGAPSIGDAKWNDRVTVTFLQVEPALYGIEREVTVPDGGTLRFVVGGDYPTKPTMSSDEAVRDPTTLLWGLRLDDGDVMRVKVPVATASTVRMDCAERTCEVNGATTIPTLQSDWFAFKPGAHELRNDQGTGACVVRWHERWHR